MLVGAAPALAQQQEQEGPYYAEETTITGVVSTKELPNITQPIYVIADEESGVDRPIQSLGPDEGGPVLSQYVGQRVTVTGIPQTLGNPPSNFDNFLTDVPVLVTSIETLESGSGGGGVLVEASGVLEDPQATSYQYGEYAITDEQSGSIYALQSDSVDLSKYVGQQVSVTGKTVEGYPVDNGPPLVNVTEIESSGGGGENPSGDPIEVTFELTVDGVVPENRTLGLSLPGTADIGGAFCSTFSDSDLPRCEEGATYNATFFSIGNSVSTGPLTWSSGTTLSYEYSVSSGRNFSEVFKAATITPTEDTTVSATYQAGGEQSPPQDQYDQHGEPDDTGKDPGDTDNVSNVGNGDTSDGSEQNEQSNETQKEAQEELQVLPDTGGLPLWGVGVAALGTVLVTGGVLLRRLLS
jgi:hypothetical protein